MRQKPLDSSCVTLNNGLTIKGSFSYSQGGLHVNLYLVNATGHIMANRNYPFAKQVSEGQEKMLTLVGALTQLCLKSGFDALTQPRIQEAAAKTLMQLLTKDSVFKKQA